MGVLPFIVVADDYLTSYSEPSQKKKKQVKFREATQTLHKQTPEM